MAIQGPTGRTVNCRISLIQREGNPPTVVEDLPELTLPVTNGVWHSYFQKHFQSSAKAQHAYDSSRICLLEFTADELGKFVIRCEREFTPLRWSISARDRVARIHDDSGEPGEPMLSRFSFETPLTEEDLLSVNEFPIDNKGGMYVAQTPSGKFQAAIVIAPMIQPNRLDSLMIEPSIGQREKSTSSVIATIKTAELWSRARTFRRSYVKLWAPQDCPDS